MKLVMPVYESALVRDEAGHVLCHVCGCAMQAWTPCEGATWYECDCGEVMVVVGGGDMLGQQVSYEGAHGPVSGVTVRDARG